MNTLGTAQNQPKLTPRREMRLRPVLECRMPTLASKAAFMLQGDERSAMPGALGHHSDGLRRLQQSEPPRSMRDVRAAVTKEMKSVTRRVARLEREYYGDQKTVHNDIEKYAFSIKVLMKALWILDLNKATAIDEMIKQAANPDRYKGDPKHPAALREVWSKVQMFLPDRISMLVESCQGLLNNLVRYCVSFYDAEKDGYLETPAHYSEQIAVWKEKAELSIQSARSLYKKFRTAGINASMLSSPVKTFCSRNDINKLLFLVMFADACTHIRNALSVMTQWLKTDENYATYVRNDLTELEKLKEEKMKVLRDIRQRCHTLTYSLSKLEQDQARLTQGLKLMKEKEQSLRIEEVSLVNTLNDMELEIEFKERRRDNMRKRPVSEHNECSSETCDTLTYDLRNLKEKLPVVARTLGQVRMKLHAVDGKISHLEKVKQELKATKKELKQAEEERDLKEQEFAETEEAAQLARKILLCKTANDATEKLYYSVPFGTQTVKTKGETSKDKGPMARMCKVISTKIDKDWVHLYQNLPFHPQRGQETIERDVAELTEIGARASVAWTARQALDRWKRYHTRASTEDLRRTLKKIRRADILKVIDEAGLKAPVKVLDPFESNEEAPPPVGPELAPYYRLIERYDQIRASKVKS